MKLGGNYRDTGQCEADRTDCGRGRTQPMQVAGNVCVILRNVDTVALKSADSEVRRIGVAGRPAAA